MVHVYRLLYLHQKYLVCSALRVFDKWFFFFLAVENSQSFSLSTLQRQKQAFSTKLQQFKMTMARLGFAQGSRLKFNIRRDHLLEDAYEHVMKSDIRHLQRKRLNITFKGEEG